MFDCTSSFRGKHSSNTHCENFTLLAIVNVLVVQLRPGSLRLRHVTRTHIHLRCAAVQVAKLASQDEDFPHVRSCLTPTCEWIPWDPHCEVSFSHFAFGEK